MITKCNFEISGTLQCVWQKGWRSRKWSSQHSPVHFKLMINIVGFIGIEQSIGDNYVLSTRLHVLKVVVQASP